MDKHKFAKQKVQARLGEPVDSIKEGLCLARSLGTKVRNGGLKGLECGLAYN